MDVVQPSSQPGPGAARSAGRGTWLAALALLLLVAGCRREEVTSYRLAKSPPSAEAPSSGDSKGGIAPAGGSPSGDGR
jgi:hypothetical protein